MPCHLFSWGVGIFSTRTTRVQHYCFYWCTLIVTCPCAPSVPRRVTILQWWVGVVESLTPLAKIKVWCRNYHVWLSDVYLHLSRWYLSGLWSRMVVMIPPLPLHLQPNNDNLSIFLCQHETKLSYTIHTSFTRMVTGSNPLVVHDIPFHRPTLR